MEMNRFLWMIYHIVFETVLFLLYNFKSTIVKLFAPFFFGVILLLLIIIVLEEFIIVFLLSIIIVLLLLYLFLPFLILFLVFFCS